MTAKRSALVNSAENSVNKYIQNLREKENEVCMSHKIQRVFVLKHR